MTKRTLHEKRVWIKNDISITFFQNIFLDLNFRNTFLISRNSFLKYIFRFCVPNYFLWNTFPNSDIQNTFLNIENSFPSIFRFSFLKYIFCRFSLLEQNFNFWIIYFEFLIFKSKIKDNFSLIRCMLKLIQWRTCKDYITFFQPIKYFVNVISYCYLPLQIFRHLIITL